MTALFERAGAEFLRAFLTAFLFLALGIINAPDLSSAVALSIAALAASISAGLRAVQVFVPQFSWAFLFEQPWAAWFDAATRAFVGVFIVFWADWLQAPDWTNWKAALLAAVLAAGAAAVRALQGLFTQGEFPAPQFGG